MPFKIMFYANTWDEITEFMKYYNTLVSKGFEVAIATDNTSLVVYLAVGKILVVNKNTYYPDIVVTNHSEHFKESMTLSQLEEVVL